MALPTLSKAWNFQVNGGPYTGPSDGGVTGTGWIDHFWNLKEKLKGFSPGWAVAGSGGLGAGGGGAMDGTDRWVVPSNLRWASTDAGSWVVLQNNNIRTGFQLLIQVQDGGGGWPDSSSWRVSPGGNYTGGSETGRPTATDEITLTDTVNWSSNDGQSDSRHHIMMSDDGECTRIVFCEANTPRAFYLFDVPKNPVSGWTDPWVAAAVQFSSASNVPDYGDVANADTYTWSSVGSTTMKMYWTSEGWNFDATGSAAGQRMVWGNDLEGGAFPMAAIGLASETASVRGRHGELFDIWWGSTILGNGYHYPDSLPRQFVHFGDIILPWPTTGGGAQMV